MGAPRGPARLGGMKFGVEVEFTSLPRLKAASAVYAAMKRSFGDAIRLDADTRASYPVTDAAGREWCFVYDGSVDDPGGELVTPILYYPSEVTAPGDLKRLDMAVSSIVEKGAEANDSCGVHVHVDAAPLLESKGAVRRLALIVARQQALIAEALQIRPQRHSVYCRPLAPWILHRLAKAKTNADVMRAWYSENSLGECMERSSYRRDGSRYHGLNLHSVWHRGTVEFRYFNGTLDFPKILAYVHLCLCLVGYALRAQRPGRVVPREVEATSAKYDFRCLLLRLGMIGDEFASTRRVLLAHLGGDVAWKKARPRRPAVAPVGEPR